MKQENRSNLPQIFVEEVKPVLQDQRALKQAQHGAEMIERFYSSNLTAEMNIELLQSKRTTSNLPKLA